LRFVYFLTWENQRDRYRPTVSPSVSTRTLFVERPVFSFIYNWLFHYPLLSSSSAMCWLSHAS